jgi:hypothetical protein
MADLSPTMPGRIEASSPNGGRNTPDNRSPKTAKPLRPINSASASFDPPAVEPDKDEKHQLDERA